MKDATWKNDVLFKKIRNLKKWIQRRFEVTLCDWPKVKIPNLGIMLQPYTYRKLTWNVFIDPHHFALVNTKSVSAIGQLLPQ